MTCTIAGGFHQNTLYFEGKRQQMKNPELSIQPVDLLFPACGR